MKEYRAKISENGRFVIPSSCRKELHFEAGEEVILRVENDELHILSLKKAIKNAQDIVQKYAKKQRLVDSLQQLRDEDEKL